MDSSTLAAWAAAAVAMLGAAVAAWQAALSKRQARYASRSANAAEATAADTQRAADVTELDSLRSEIDRERMAWASELRALREVENRMYKAADALLKIADHVEDHPDDGSSCQLCKDGCNDLSEAWQLVQEAALGVVDNATGPVSVEYAKQALIASRELLVALGTFETENTARFAEVVRIQASATRGIAVVLSRALCRMAGERLAADTLARARAIRTRPS